MFNTSWRVSMNRYTFILLSILILSIAGVFSTLIYCVNKSNTVAYQEISKMVATGIKPSDAGCAIWNTTPICPLGILR